MKRVTNKTAMNIYTRWMTISAVEYDWVFNNMSLDELSKTDKSLVLFNWVLDDYTDKQIQKIIKGLDNNSQWEAEYLKNILLHLLKSNLRERKLNKIL